MPRALEHTLQVTGVTVLVLLGIAAPASSQTASNPWSHGTTLELFGGAGDAPPSTKAVAGAALGWEINHRLEIEGVGAWLPEQDSTQSFAADLKLLFNLMRPARFVPYAGAGVGLYWASFDQVDAAMPPFYRERALNLSAASRATFTDPTAVFAAGANYYVGRHLSVRPEVALRMVTDGSSTYNVTTVTFALIYHVEDHPKD